MIKGGLIWLFFLIIRLFKEKRYVELFKGFILSLKGNVNILDALNIISLGYEENKKNKIDLVKNRIKKGDSLEIAFKEITDDKEFLQMIKIEKKYVKSSEYIRRISIRNMGVQG